VSEFQAVVFYLNNQLCGADTLQVQEIIKYRDVVNIPRMPKFIDGVINIRGTVVPVVNLNRRFDLGDTKITSKTKIVVTLINKKFVGFIVNDVTEIIKFSDEEVELPPETIYNNGNSFMKFIGKKGEKLISILDLSKILTDNEIKRINNKDVL